MKLVKWSYQNLVIPMMEDDSGEMYCTSQAICGALGIKSTALDVIHHRHKEEFDGLSLTDCKAIEFFRKHRADLGLKYVRGDMRLWSEDDMLTFAFHSHSPVAREFLRNLRQFIKANARRDMVSRDQFDELVKEVETMKRWMIAAAPAANETASLTGSMLCLQKKTKPVRKVLN